MKMTTTKERILSAASKLFSRNGADGCSMRDIANESAIAQSVIYYHFQDRDELLKMMFNSLNTNLGRARQKLAPSANASAMLLGRIEFQLDHAEEITAVLKYFFAYKSFFPKYQGGYVPEKAYLHIQEVLEYGVATGEFSVKDIAADSKVITHAINGFIMEYFPHIPKKEEKMKLARTIHSFLMRSIQPSSSFATSRKRSIKKIT